MRSCSLHSVNGSLPTFVDEWRGLSGRIDLRLDLNPGLMILHTVRQLTAKSKALSFKLNSRLLLEQILVHSNGFIHGATSGTAERRDEFEGEEHYFKWIQPK